ncbi:TPR repeat protein oca3 [Rhypophila sp. PSN 637]
MSPSLLLHPPGQLSPAAALYLSQQAPAVLQGSPSTVSSSPLSALFSEKESPELWLKYENLLLSCLRTGDEQAAHQCLERLVTRFGDDNERIMAFKGLLKEADAQQNGDLVRILNEYDQILSENDTNIPITKRRISLLRSMGRVSDAASSLVQLLEFSPTDAEAWSELSDIYLSQGLYAQAIYALEEVLVLAPNAWNIHARLGEMQYMAANATGASSGSYQQYMAEALKRFARSIELCDDYLRGYYGLKLVTNKLLQDSNKSNKQVDDDEFALPDVGTIERLNSLSTAKLSEIVRHSTAQDRGWRGYDPVEVAAARELLSSDAAAIER